MIQNVICWEWPEEQSLQDFSLFHPVVPPSVPLGTGKQAGNSSVMGFVYLVILFVQVIVIFSLFLFRALILCVSLPSFLLLLMENIFIDLLTVNRKAQVFSAVD